MKTGKTLMQLAAELTAVRENARDFIVPAASLRATVVTGDAPQAALDQRQDLVQAGARADRISLAFEAKGEQLSVSLNNWSSGQLAGYADVPKAYYDRLAAQNPTLLAANVNHGLRLQNGDKRMLRLFDGTLRGMMSSKYRRLDGADLLDATLPHLLDSGMQVVSSELTDRRLYLRATTDRLQTEVAKGDVVQAGIMISNSDVGAGSLRVEPFIVRLVCLNGMVMQHALKKAHLGRSLAVGDETMELLSDATIRLGEKAFWAEVQDVVKACLSPEMFAREVDRMKAATEVKITNFDLQEVVELTCRRIGMANVGEVTKASIVEALASGNQGAGLTQWGLANSFTAAAAADHLDFDMSVELERAGSSILDLSQTDWKVVAQKKAA